MSTEGNIIHHYFSGTKETICEGDESRRSIEGSHIFTRCISVRRECYSGVDADSIGSTADFLNDQ